MDEQTQEANTEKLARWSCTLNSWEWPEDMPGKPDGFDSLPEIPPKDSGWEINKFDIITGLRQAIEKAVGKKEISHWHHIHNLHRTEEQFDEWWEGQTLTGKEYEEWLEKYFNELLVEG